MEHLLVLCWVVLTDERWACLMAVPKDNEKDASKAGLMAGLMDAS